MSAAALALCFVPNAAAESDALTPPSIDWNLFGSFGLSGISTINNLDRAAMPYNNYDSEVQLDELTRIGVQSRVDLGPASEFTLQVVSRGSRDYEFEVEWAYFGHQITPETRLRVGRLRRPMFRLAEEKHVGFVYNWVQPPVLTYYNFDGYYAPITAVDLIHRGEGRGFDWSAELYVGVGQRDNFDLGDFDASYRTEFNSGVNLGADIGPLSVWAGVSTARFSIDIDGMSALSQGLRQLGRDDLADNVSTEDNLAMFMSMGAEYNFGSWELNTELTRGTSDTDLLSDTTGGHLALHRNFGEFTLGYTFSFQKGRPPGDPVADIEAAAAEESIPQIAQGLMGVADGLRDFAYTVDYSRSAHTIGLRYDFLPNVALKLQYERMTDERFDEGYDSGALVVDYVY